MSLHYITDTWMHKMYKEYVEDAGDPRTRGWFLIDSLIPPFWITFFYLMFVTHLGPNYMKERKPFNLKRTILVYNALQVLANVGILYWVGFRMILNENYFCMRVLTDDPERNAFMPPIGYAYYMLKYVDMLDTLFFVLTKKQHFVSGLHLFHHTSMIFATWFGMKYYPSGALAIAPYLNTWVHAVMYCYYFCTIYYGKIAIQWKKIMTSIQLVQFLTGTAVFIVHVFNPWCDFPKLILLPVILHGFTFIYMFGQFYYKNYIARAPTVKSD